MSNRQALGARLEGHQGPFFPPSTARLNTLFNHPLVGRLVVENAARDLYPANIVLDRLFATTVDGYSWYASVRLHDASGNAVIVLFPWLQDFDGNDGTKLDRSVAVYTARSVDPDAAEALIASFADAIENALQQVVARRAR